GAGSCRPRAGCGRRRLADRHQLPGLRRLDERARCPNRARSRGGVSIPFVIAIDGPSAAGKGTLAQRLATHFRLPHLDTGLLYRAVGWMAERTGRPPIEIAAALQPRDLDDPELRTDQAGQAGSKVAAI